MPENHTATQSTPICAEANPNVRDHSGKKAHHYLQQGTVLNPPAQHVLTYVESDWDLILLPGRDYRTPSVSKDTHVLHHCTTSLSDLDLDDEEDWVLV